MSKLAEPTRDGGSLFHAIANRNTTSGNIQHVERRGLSPRTRRRGLLLTSALVPALVLAPPALMAVPQISVAQTLIPTGTQGSSGVPAQVLPGGGGGAGLFNSAGAAGDLVFGGAGGVGAIMGTTLAGPGYDGVNNSTPTNAGGAAGVISGGTVTGVGGTGGGGAVGGAQGYISSGLILVVAGGGGGAGLLLTTTGTYDTGAIITGSAGGAGGGSPAAVFLNATPYSEVVVPAARDCSLAPPPSPQ